MQVVVEDRKTAFRFSDWLEGCLWRVEEPTLRDALNQGIER